MCVKKARKRSSIGMISLIFIGALIAGCSGGDSPGSILASVPAYVNPDVTPPGSMTDVWAAQAGSNQIKLSWVTATDDTSTSLNITYEICLGVAAGDCDTFTVSATTAAGASSYSVTGLTSSTEYFFKVRARDEAGNVGAPSSEFSATTDPDGTVNVPTFDPVANIYGAAQSVSMSSTTAGATVCYTADGTTPSCDVNASCVAATPYIDVVTVDATQTLKAIACMAGSVDSSIATAAYVIDITAPSNVTGLNATAAGESQVILSWTAVLDDASAPENIIYEVCQSSVSAECENFTVSATTAPGVNSYTVTGLTSLTDYYFQVRAKDEIGNISSGGVEVMATTDASGTVNAPSFNLVAGTYESDKSIELTTTTSDATIYYTLDGTDPTLSSMEYTGAIDIVGDGTAITVKAIADKIDMVGSAIATTTYEIKYPVTSSMISIQNTNAAALSDFQVRVVLDSRFDFTGFSDTGDEARFYHDGTELSYYVESFDKAAQTAIYWVKVDSLPLNTTTGITLSPFKVGLSAGSDGRGTFVFYDGFDRADLGPDWVIGGFGEGTISIDNGALDLWGNLDGVYIADNFISTMLVTYSDIPGMKGTDSFVSVARMYREHNSDQYWKLSGVNAAASDYAQRGLWLVNSDTTTNLINTYVWKTYQVTVDDANNIIYERGNSLDSLTEKLTGTRAQQTDAAPSMTFQYAYAVNNHVKVDWVFIRKYAAIDPTITITY